MTKTIRLTQALAAEYQHLFDTCSIQPQHRAAVARLAEQLNEQQPRYAAVAQLTDIPWPVIAVIHELEASQRLGIRNAQTIYQTCRTTKQTRIFFLKIIVLIALHHIKRPKKLACTLQPVALLQISLTHDQQPLPAL